MEASKVTVLTLLVVNVQSVLVCGGYQGKYLKTNATRLAAVCASMIPS